MLALVNSCHLSFLPCFIAFLYSKAMATEYRKALKWSETMTWDAFNNSECEINHLLFNNLTLLIFAVPGGSGR